MANTVVPFGGWRHRAAHLYLLLVLFSFPLFSVPCPKGTCSSPVEVVVVHLLTKNFDHSIVKVIMYPASLFSKLEAIVADNEQIGLPDWDSLLDNTVTGIKENEQRPKKFALGLIIGSYLCVAGAIACMLGPTYLSAFGPLIILWSVYTENDVADEAYVLPIFSIAVFCSLSGTIMLGRSKKTSDSVSPEEPSTSDEGLQQADSDKKRS